MAEKQLLILILIACFVTITCTFKRNNELREYYNQTGNDFNCLYRLGNE